MPGAQVCWESLPPTHQEMKLTCPSLNLPATLVQMMSLGAGLCVREHVCLGNPSLSHTNHGGQISLS